MKSIIEYIKEVIMGVWSLLKGMQVTGSYFIRPKTIVTQKYPENRKTLVMLERFKGEVVMPHNDKNEHKCTGCGQCIKKCKINEMGKLGIQKSSGQLNKSTLIEHKLSSHYFKSRWYI